MPVSAIKRNIQTTSHLCMVRPCHFDFNQQTAESNAFQKHPSALSPEEIQLRALEEFDIFVNLLKAENIRVTVFDDIPSPYTPDSIFPNNWISSHRDGKVIVYPILAPNRRLEKRKIIIDFFLSQHENPRLIDWSFYEEKSLFLEGTGSMIIDRIFNTVYACVSPRTNPDMLNLFCETFNYKPILFRARDLTGVEIYHTNVMMNLGTNFAIVGLVAIDGAQKKKMVIDELKKTKREIITISMEQISQFAGNMLEVQNEQGKSYLVMSKRAFNSLHPAQLDIIKRHSHPLVIPLDVIETFGGGSVRCMLAEVFH